MTSQPVHDMTVGTLSAAEHQVLDRLADILAATVDTSSPQAIAADLHRFYDGDLFTPQPTDAASNREPVRAEKPWLPGVVWADGYRQQIPGWWPHYPVEAHQHYTSGFWTRDGSQLVLSCCGLDGA